MYIFRNVTACNHRRPSTINPTTKSSSDLPNVIANNELRAFRAQGNLSGKDFNVLWWHICNFITAPPNDILLDTSSAGETEYEWKIIDIMRDVLAAGLFAPRSRGSWRFNSGAGQEGIYRYIGALVAYAAGEVMKQIPEGDFTQSVKSNNVYRWLMHESADWDEYGHVATVFVPATDVASTVVSVSSQTSVSSCDAIVPETVCDAAENINDGEHATGV